MDTYFPDRDYCQLCHQQTAPPGHEYCIACRHLIGAVSLRPTLALKVAMHYWLNNAREELGRFWWVTLLACALVLGVAIGLVILMCRAGVLMP